MSTDHEIRQILDSKAAALVDRAVELLREIIHPAFLYINVRGERFDRDRYIATFGGLGPIRFLSQTFDNVEVRDFGTSAIAAMDIRDRFEIEGRVVVGAARSLCVFVREGPRWLWSAGQTVSLERPERETD